MKPVIGKQNQDGVVPVRRSLHRIQHQPEAVIGERYRGEVGLHRVLPLPGGLHPGMFGRDMVLIGQCNRILTEIVAIVRFHLGELNLIQRKEIEPFLRRIHRHVGTIETDPHEKRLLEILRHRLQFLDRPLGNLVIRHVLVPLRKRTPIPERVTMRLGDLLLRSRTKTSHAASILLEETLVAAMEKFPRCKCIVAMLRKTLRHRVEILEGRGLLQIWTEEIDPGRMRMTPRHETGPRGIADRRLAMRIGKQRSLGSESVDIRRLSPADARRDNRSSRSGRQSRTG